MWRWVAFPLPLAAAIAVAGLAAASLPAAPSAPEAVLQLAPNFPGGPYYALGCSSSHRNNDDPIVYPGQPGKSRNHTYIGNRSVNADTTPVSLLGGRTSCKSDFDSSAYWVPTLFTGREDVEPLTAIVYYVNRSNERISAPRRGSSCSRATRWLPTASRKASCRGAAARSADVRATPSSRPAVPTRCCQLQVTFPNCWDGRRLDSPDHRQHVKYASRGACPTSHPVALPTIVLIVLYPPGPRGSHVASGRFAAHAGFMNGWDQAELDRRVRERSLRR